MKNACLRKRAMYTKASCACDVRRRWSPDERLRAVKGLPPDTPWTLFRALLAPPQNGERAGFDSPRAHRSLQRQIAPASEPPGREQGEAQLPQQVISRKFLGLANSSSRPYQSRCVK